MNRYQSSEVEAFSWEEFRSWFGEHWERGQHIAMVMPTGGGKTTLAVGFLDLHPHVLALDFKGGDPTLDRLRAKGFIRSTSWPLKSQDWRKIEDKKQPARYILGPPKTSLANQKEVISKFMGRVLSDAWEQEGWTLYFDELWLAAVAMLLGKSIEQMLVSARSAGISIVSAFQRPRGIPVAAGDQATWLMVGYTRDLYSVDRIAEMAGRPREEIRGAIKGIDEDFVVLIFSRKPKDPIIVTRAPHA